jgi:hypothetical protein
MNVMVVDWSGGSFDQYHQAVANTRVVGAVIAELIKALHNTTQLDYSNVHFIGHSLGSHICGFAGERIPGLGRITGKLQVKISCKGFTLYLYFLYLFYAYWCPTRFPYQMVFVSLSSNTTGVTSEAGTTNTAGASQFFVEFIFSIFAFCVVFLYYCLSFFSFSHYIVYPSIYGF